MIYAEQGNRVKEISERDIQKYLEMGYNIVNEAGVVLQESVPTDIPTLRLAYVQNADKIKQLTAEVKRLTAENVQLNESIKNMEKKAVEEVKVAPAVEEPVTIEETPKRTRKSRNTESVE